MGIDEIQKNTSRTGLVSGSGLPGSTWIVSGTPSASYLNPIGIEAALAFRPAMPSFSSVESMQKPFYAVVEPKRTIYVETDDPAIALKTAMRVRQLSGEIAGVGFSSPPNIERRMVDPNLLKNAQEYEGVRYWVVPS